MTETTSLLPNEWQALCHGSAQQLANYLAGTATMGDEQVKAIDDHLARLRTFIGGWKHSSAQFATTQQPAPQVQPEPIREAPAPKPNGEDISERTGKPKRKYTRKAKPEASAETVQ